MVELAERLRALVRTTVPEAEERAYPGWHGIGYRHPEAGYLCGIFPSDDEVRLLFEHGVLLPDPDGLLEGDGTQTRHVALDDPAHVPEEKLARLIEASLGDLGGPQFEADLKT